MAFLFLFNRDCIEDPDNVCDEITFYLLAISVALSKYKLKKVKKEDRNLDINGTLSMKKLLAVTFGNAMLSKIENDNNLRDVDDDQLDGNFDGVGQNDDSQENPFAIIIENSKKKRKGKRKQKEKVKEKANKRRKRKSNDNCNDNTNDYDENKNKKRGGRRKKRS